MAGNALTPRQAGERLGLSTETVVRYLKRGLIPGVKIGRYWRVPEEGLVRFMNGPREYLEWALERIPGTDPDEFQLTAEPGPGYQTLDALRDVIADNPPCRLRMGCSLTVWNQPPWGRIIGAIWAEGRPVSAVVEVLR